MSKRAPVPEGATLCARIYRVGIKLNSTEQETAAKHKSKVRVPGPDWLQIVVDFITCPLVQEKLEAAHKSKAKEPAGEDEPAPEPKQKKKAGRKLVSAESA